MICTYCMVIVCRLFSVLWACEAFRKDANDPDRLLVPLDHLPFYYNRYFKKAGCNGHVLWNVVKSPTQNSQDWLTNSSILAHFSVWKIRWCWELKIEILLHHRPGLLSLQHTAALWCGKSCPKGNPQSWQSCLIWCNWQRATNTSPVIAFLPGMSTSVVIKFTYIVVQIL